MTTMVAIRIVKAVSTAQYNKTAAIRVVKPVTTTQYRYLYNKDFKLTRRINLIFIDHKSSPMNHYY
jgi:hypothetical protein